MNRDDGFLRMGAGLWLIVEFDSDRDDVWDDLDWWNHNPDVVVDYEYQTVWFPLDLSAMS